MDVDEDVSSALRRIDELIIQIQGGKVEQSNDQYGVRFQTAPNSQGSIDNILVKENEFNQVQENEVNNDLIPPDTFSSDEQRYEAVLRLAEVGRLSEQGVSENERKIRSNLQHLRTLGGGAAGFAADVITIGRELGVPM